jgi:hypothetical protein
VVGIPAGLVVRHVARRAIGGRSGELAVHVALRTCDCDVRSGEREPGQGVVIELRSGPLHGGVAGLARIWESGGGMARICCISKISKVTRCAIGRRAGILSSDVTLSTGDCNVRTSERELGQSVVIEFGAVPACSGVTGTAFAREPGGDMVRIRAGVVVLGVAGIAGCTGALELSANVAGRAVERCVRSSESKAGEAQVIELGTAPTVEGMAIRAGDPEAEGDVIGILSCAVLVYVT